MADFSDDFQEASDTRLRDHTPDTGTSWDETLTSGDGTFQIVAGQDGIEPSMSEFAGESVGVGKVIINPQITSADKQIWFQLGGDRTFVNCFAAVRLDDEADCVGFRQAGAGSGGSRLSKRVAGTVTDLINTGSSTGDWFRVYADGDQIGFWYSSGTTEPTDPEADTNWTEVTGSPVTVTDHETIQDCGVSNGGTNTGIPFLQKFRSSSLGGGGTTTTLTADGATLTASPATATNTITMAAAAAALSLVGGTATFSEAVVLDAQPATMALTGGTATFAITSSSQGAALALSGGTATFSEAVVLDAQPGSLTLSGGAALHSTTLNAEAAPLTLSGGTATFSEAVTLDAQGAALALSGGTADFVQTIVLDAQGATLTLSGGDATLTLPSPTLNAESGTLALSGGEATLTATSDQVFRRGGVRFIVEPEPETRDEKVKELKRLVRPEIRRQASQQTPPALADGAITKKVTLPAAKRSRVDRLLSETGLTIEELLIILG